MQQRFLKSDGGGAFFTLRKLAVPNRDYPFDRLNPEGKPPSILRQAG
jgi:hypothetical protein